MDKLTVNDDEQWVKEQGVPSFEEPFIQKYLQGRDALVAQEKKQRSGSWLLKRHLASLVHINKALTCQSRPCVLGDFVTHGS